VSKERMQGCTVASFDPTPGTDVYDALREFYVCQTEVRNNLASMIFGEDFLRPLIEDVHARLKKVTLFRKKGDPEIPFPWRKLLDIVFQVAKIDTTRAKLFTADAVRDHILRLCHVELLGGRRSMCRLLKTPLKLRGRYGMQLAAAEDVGMYGVVRRDPIYINERRAYGSEHKIGFRSHLGPHMQAARTALYAKRPYLVPDGHRLPTH